MGSAPRWFRRAASVGLVAMLAITAAAEPSAVEQERLNRFAAEYRGAVVFTRYDHVFRVELGGWTPQDLGPGRYARWSPDGTRIAVYWRDAIVVMEADGSGRRTVALDAVEQDGCPLDFHPNGREVVYLREGRRGLWAVDVSTKRVRLLSDSQAFTGEPALSEDGTRLVGRVGRSLWAVDLNTGAAFPYAEPGCGAAISPNGAWLLSSDDTPDAPTPRLVLRDWSLQTVRTVSGDSSLPDRRWDNAHWSNLPELVAVQGIDRGETYIVNLRSREAIRVTWIGETTYPDLWAVPRQ